MSTAALGERDTAAGVPRRWYPVLLAGICLLAGVLHFWGIGESWGNSYYSAAVKSMSQSFENFFFGSFDPAGVVTVDKPPAALWVQVLSVLVFGYNKVAVLLPQAVAGVAAVFLLHRTVRRWAGERAGLLAALVLALTPITVAIDRDNNPDTLLVLLVIGAAYALTRAIRAERAKAATWWVLLSALLVGCGFLVKMLQAWMVLPVFAVAYLVGREAGWGRKIADLAGAGVVVLVSSFWWVAATMLWPAPKPYIGGSEDGTALDLIFGYNGFGRILGGEGNGGGSHGGGPGGGGPGGGFSGQAGLLRLFNEKLGGQISWLLPLCALVLVAVVVAGVLRRRSGEPVDRARVAGWVLWGGWLVFVGFMFSSAKGTMHPYYTTMLAPAVGAVAGAGIVAAWRVYRRPGRAWLVVLVGVLITDAWAVVLVRRNPEWHGWTAWAAIGLGALAVVALLLGRRAAVPGALGKAGAVLALAAVLVVPGTWSAITAFGGQESPMGGANPMAGPSEMGMPGGMSGGRHGGFPAGGPPGGQMPGGQVPGGQMPFGGMRGGPGAMQQLSEQQQKVLTHVTALAGQREIPLALEGGAMGSSSYIINSDVRVIGMGGFTGSDNAPSVPQLAAWKQAGQLGFVQLSGHEHGGRHGGPGMSGYSTARQNWVKRNCRAVDPAEYGGSAGTSGSGGPMMSTGPLYDCR